MKSELLSLVLSILVQTTSCLQLHSHNYDVVILCPDDYVPRDGCVTADQLISSKLIKSNTTFKFVPAFKMEPNQVLGFENVSNITLDTTGPTEAGILCLGENSGLTFKWIQGLTVRNLQIIDCAVNNVEYSGIMDATINSTISIIASSNVLLENITFKRGKTDAFGVIILNIYGYFTVSNVTFKYMQGPALYVENNSPCEPLHQNCSGSLQATAVNTVFDSANYASVDLLYSYITAFAIGIVFNGQKIPVNVHISDVLVINNTHDTETSGFSIVSVGDIQIKAVLERCLYENNYVIPTKWLSTGVLDGEQMASSDVLIYFGDGTTNKSSVKISNSSFCGNDYTNNIYGAFERDFYFNFMFLGIRNTGELTISLRNTTISNNTGSYGAAILSNFDCDDKNLFDMQLEMRDLKIANNIFNTTYYDKAGLIHFVCTASVIMHGCAIESNINSSTGLLLEDSSINFTGKNTVRGNSNYNGGGMAIYGDSHMTLTENSSTLLFEDNFAENFGGAMYVQVDYKHYCFFDIGVPEPKSFTNVTVSLMFVSNRARTAGNDIYGGYLHNCAYHTGISSYYYLPAWQAMTDVVHTPTDYAIDVTSDPLHVCDCSERNEDCIHKVPVINSVKAYPGESFNLSLVAVGQLLNTTTLSGVPSVIHAGIVPLHPNSADIPPEMRIQNGMRNCSLLNFAVRSTNQYEVMVLAINDDLNLIPDYFVRIWNSKDHRGANLYNELTIPAFVTVELLPCPVGFELSEKERECMCAPALVDLVIECDINNERLMKKSSVWISEDPIRVENGSSYSYLTHRYCPPDFCNSSDRFSFSLKDPDTQCLHNRTGTLCGKCKPGYSLMLGSMECRKCSNVYLLLLIPFALAGILLILFLSLTDMTVAAGTTNGLLLYANIVWGNKATFFTPKSHNGFLAVFIAWLNLDLGISSCFYDGLDSYSYTWLQLAFPAFIWFLAFSIIIESRHFAFVNKLCGQNIVQVLASLFLLSYTKLQRTIVTSLSFTEITASNGTNYYVWLQDGNTLYLQGKHIALFVVNNLFLLILFIPYTLSIALGPWLQTKTQYRVFRWVLKLKPFFDAYYGPLKDKHRYWTGALLFARMVLSLINIMDRPHVDLLSTIVICLVLLVMLLYKEAGGIYKIHFITLLDTFFLINLVIVASATLYCEVSGGNSNISASISVGATFVVFSLTLLYHCLKKLTSCYTHRNQRLERPLLDGNDHCNRAINSDDAMLYYIDAGRGTNALTQCAADNSYGRNLDTY